MASKGTLAESTFVSYLADYIRHHFNCEGVEQIVSVGEHLFEIALAEWLPLFSGEIAVIDAVLKGEWADLSSETREDDDLDMTCPWGERRFVRAEFLRWLCTDRDITALIDPRGIRIYRATIIGPLDLSFSTIPFPLVMFGCYLTDHVDLHLATIQGLYLQGSHLGSLAGDGMIVQGGVHLNKGFQATGEVRLIGAYIGGDFQCNAGGFKPDEGRALYCERMTVKGNLFLNQGFQATGEVRLTGSNIGGDVLCDCGHFEPTVGAALNCAFTTVKGSVHLSDGFHATGAVSLLDSDLGGLTFSGGCIEVSDGAAMLGDRMTVRGSVFLNQGFYANGEIRLVIANIGGDVQCACGHFAPRCGIALNCGSMTAKGSVYLNEGFQATGKVHLAGANIGSNLVFHNGCIQVNEKYAVVARGLHVAGETVFTSTNDDGFETNGVLNLSLARLDQGLEFSGVRFTGGERNGLEAQQVNVGGSFIWTSVSCGDETFVDLPDTSVFEFVTDGGLGTWRSCWPTQGQLILDGFVYQRIAGIPSKQSDRTAWVERMLEWMRLQQGYTVRDNGRFRHAREAIARLRAMSHQSSETGEPAFGYTPQPYEQLAAVLRQTGHIDEARDVARRKLDDFRTDGEPGKWLWWRNWFLSWSIGHGYQPWRPLTFGLIVIVLGTLVFYLAHDSDRLVAVVDDREGAGSYPWFNPIAYSIDTFLPFVDLDQQESFQPNAKGWGGWSVLAFYWFQISIGWVISTLFVLGFTSLVRQE
jgi:hypothetical protein